MSTSTWYETGAHNPLENKPTTRSGWYAGRSSFSHDIIYYVGRILQKYCNKFKILASNRQKRRSRYNDRTYIYMSGNVTTILGTAVDQLLLYDLWLKFISLTQLNPRWPLMWTYHLGLITSRGLPTGLGRWPWTSTFEGATLTVYIGHEMTSI